MNSKRVRDMALRLAGAISLAAAYANGRLLCQIAPHQSGPPHTVLPYLLALATFACASIGAALLIFGRQLRQPVVISDRWATSADLKRWPITDNITPANSAQGDEQGAVLRPHLHGRPSLSPTSKAAPSINRKSGS